MPAVRRPQTLKQAKRAYQKTGPARPSASDIAQAERRTALQERADRIREREARRKLNLKKRDEKIAKEREAARRTGKPFLEDQKPRWKVGASQRRLGIFLFEEAVISENSPEREVKADTAEPEPEHCQELSNRSLKTLLPPAPIAGILPEEKHSVYSAREMPPPPKPQPSKQLVVLDDALEECFPSNTQIQRELSPESRKANTYNPKNPLQKNDTGQNSIDTNSFLACISTQDLNLSSPPDASSTLHRESDLLAYISTQDLDLQDLSQKSAIATLASDAEIVAAQISTQDLMFSQEVPEVGTEIRSAGSESFTDADFEDFIMECGTVSSSNMALVDPWSICT